jgi:hypothetical protein
MEISRTHGKYGCARGHNCQSSGEGIAVEEASVERGGNLTTSEKGDAGRESEDNEGGGEEDGGGDHIKALLPSVHRGALEILRRSMAALVALKG